MTSKEAKTFEKIASLSTETNIIPKDFDDSVLDWNSVSLLQDIGLVKSGDLTVNTITFSGKNRLYCKNANIIIVLSELKGDKTTFETPCFVLTSEGAQLKDALSIHMSDNDIINLGNKLKKRNHNKDIEIKAHKIINIEGRAISFDINDLLV